MEACRARPGSAEPGLFRTIRGRWIAGYRSAGNRAGRFRTRTPMCRERPAAKPPL